MPSNTSYFSLHSVLPGCDPLGDAGFKMQNVNEEGNGVKGRKKHGYTVN